MVTGDFHSPCRTLVPEINNHNKRWNGKLKAGVIKVAAWSCSDLENLSFDAYTDAWKCLNKPCMKHSEMKCFLNKATPKILAISVSRYHVTSTISSGFSLNVLLVPSMSVLSFLHHSSLQIWKFLLLLPRYRQNSKCPVRGDVDR